MFLTDNLWTIFEVAKEYRETGKGGDLGVAPDIYLNALKGNEDLRCVQADPAKLTEWEAEDQAAARAEYRALVGNTGRPSRRPRRAAWPSSTSPRAWTRPSNGHPQGLPLPCGQLPEGTGPARLLPGVPLCGGHRWGGGQRQVLRPDSGHRGQRPLLRRPCQRGRGHLAERGRGGNRLALRGQALPPPQVPECQQHRHRDVLPPGRRRGLVHMAAAAELGRDIMARYGIPLENVLRHYDVTGKLCPRPLIDEDKWAAFKARLEDDMVSYKTIEDVPASYRPSVQKLMDRGGLKGYDNGAIYVSEDLCRTITILDRLGLLDGR